ncbi:ABC transporter ATP-binding protein [Candidatus Bipolaricaulota bacterium]|nr:ABC transporter ATP-binding protein [Candidatus Bipolaricaulota bacterium]
MITAKGLTRRFGDLIAVDGLNLHIDRGEVFGFLGPNGAGKTTTVRMLSALIEPTSGSASVGGRALGRENRAIRQSVGVLTETPGLYKRLSAWDNLLFFAKLYGIDAPEKQVEKYLKMFELWDRRNGLAGTFSKGMRQKLALARALLHEPEILFLDEPTAGLDPEAAKTVRELIEALRSEERTIFLCTHNLDEADRLCDRIALFKSRLLTVGNPQSLKEKMYGRRTVIHLANPREGIENSLDLPFITKTEWIDGRLLVSLSDPDTENPVLIRKLVELGADVQFVSELKVSLEDLYLDLMEGNHGSS